MVTATNAAADRHQEFMRKTGSGEMDKNAFLELLITQLRYQDPLKPSDNGEFLAQMAQFTSLEQVQNINAGVEKLVSNQTKHQGDLVEKLDTLNENIEDLYLMLQWSQFTSLDRELQLLGKEVTVKAADGQEIVGRVESVKLEQGGSLLVVNGEAYSLTQLVKISGGDTSE